MDNGILTTVILGAALGVVIGMIRWLIVRLVSSIESKQIYDHNLLLKRIEESERLQREHEKRCLETPTSLILERLETMGVTQDRNREDVKESIKDVKSMLETSYRGLHDHIVTVDKQGQALKDQLIEFFVKTAVQQPVHPISK